MFRISAFADEIDPDPQRQAEVLTDCNIKFVELRSILKTNVLELTDLQVQELKSLLDQHGIRLSAIGSPIGKVKLDTPFEPQLTRLRRAIELCKVLGTRNIRIFSYYLPDDDNWENWRRDVLDRMWDMLRLAESADVRLVHENEHAIYGDSPERVRDLMDTVLAQASDRHFGAVYDPANYVFCGYDPWLGWELTREWTVHFHIKDWVRGQTHGCLAGDGDGRIADVLRDAAGRGYDGFVTLEPHLLGGGPTGGTTGPALFPRAAAALRKLLDDVGAQYV